MIGYQFFSYNPAQNEQSKFDQLLHIFSQLLVYTNGSAEESLSWMNELDKQYHFTDNEYGMGDFIEDLKKNGYLKESEADGSFQITAKSEQTIRKKSLEEIPYLAPNASQILRTRQHPKPVPSLLILVVVGI